MSLTRIEMQWMDAVRDLPRTIANATSDILGALGTQAAETANLAHQVADLSAADMTGVEDQLSLLNQNVQDLTCAVEAMAALQFSAGMAAGGQAVSVDSSLTMVREMASRAGENR